MADTLENFGTRVRALREQQHYTQQELADRIGISRAYLSQIEQGRAKNLSLRLAERLSTELGTELPPRETVLVDPTLRAFVEEQSLPDADAQMLAGLEYRGQRPQSKEQWRLLYNLIKTTLESNP